MVKQIIKELTQVYWNGEWQLEPTCRQTKHFFPTLRPKMSFDLVRSTRNTYSTLVQIMTGHNYMNRHQNLIDTTNGVEGDGPQCTLCGDGEMSTEHVLTECVALAQLREKHFGIQVLAPPFISLSKGALIGFLREAPIDAVRFFLESE